MPSLANSCLTLGMAKDWAKTFPRADRAMKTGTTRVTKALLPQAWMVLVILRIKTRARRITHILEELRGDGHLCCSNLKFAHSSKLDFLLVHRINQPPNPPIGRYKAYICDIG